MEIAFVGTGVSTAIPVMGHFSGCACYDAIHTPNSKNRRNNVSLLIHKKKTEEEISAAIEEKRLLVKTIPDNCRAHMNPREVDPEDVSRSWNVLIDCGKTFRDAYFGQLVNRGLSKVDALLLTHDHADAVQGLDDLRDLQAFTLEPGGGYICRYLVPTYLSQQTLKTLAQQVGYIIRNSRQLGDAPASGSLFQESYAAVEAMHPVASRVLERRSTALDLYTVRDTVPQKFHVPGICDKNTVMYSIPVEHGAGYMALGFIFGSGVAFKGSATSHSIWVGGGNPSTGDCIAYISDVSDIPNISMEFLTSLVKIDVLAIDFLLGRNEKHFSHYCWDDVWALVRLLQPKKVYGIGMFCSVEHAVTNADLSDQLQIEKEKGSCLNVESIELAYDGLTLQVAL